MPSLVTRFHLLLFAVTLAIAGVGAFRIPADLVYLAHWQAATADWLWPRAVIFIGPVVQFVLIGSFFTLGRALTKNHFAKSQHILDPALTLLMLVIVGVQLGLLLTGIGSDLDFVRFTAFALGAALLVLGLVLSEAERHTYAGLRMPWPVRSDRAWVLVHRCAGLAYGGAGIALLTLAWFDAGLGMLVLSLAAALLLPALAAALATRLFDCR